MRLIRTSFKNLVLVSCLYATCQIHSPFAESSAIDLVQLLNSFGFSVHEVCASDNANGQCYPLSIRFALEQSPGYRFRNEYSTSHAEVIDTVFNQHHADEHASVHWQPAHQLNALLAREWGLTILTMEIREHGLLHVVLTTPSDTGYEQQVIFFGEIETLLAPDLSIAQTLQQLLLTADISLVLTPGHVQPVILTPFENPLEEPDISLPVPVINAPARTLMLSELTSYMSGSEWRLRPDSDARYGARFSVRDSAARNWRRKDVLLELEKIRKEKADHYQKHKVSKRRWEIASRSIKTLATLLTAGAGYYYRESILRFIQPYWDNRAHFYKVTRQKLSHWGESCKDYSGRLLRAAYPYWVSVRNTGQELLNRYYWQQDTSACADKTKISIRASDGGSYRAKGIIAGQTVDLLIDTGASSVSMSARTARKLGFLHFAQTGILMKCHTASHRDIDCYKISLPSVQVGCIKLLNVDATVMDSENDEILLGMSFLDRLNWSKTGRLLELQAD